ncbi:MAG: RluA family pseudouridine synthase [Lachnospiraceae bacterium]|nr:RluA family pseudouridine synthase [Lachnospiraceae bacterium]
MAKEVTLIPDENTEGIRLDKFIATQYDELSRSYIQKLLTDGLISVNEKTVKASYSVTEGDVIKMTVPDSVIPDIEPENIPLDIIYEDNNIIIVNKPKNMVVHPAAGNYSGTLVNALMYHCRDNLSGINGCLRPGIVHRIDKDTTGLLVVCKNDNSHRDVAGQLKEHSITRRYEAICIGNLKEDEGVIDAPIGRSVNDRKKMAVNVRNGKNAVTHYKVLEHFHGFSHIECVLETGRTHQIRVHMSSQGHPILGDELYGGVRPEFPGLKGQCLHAGILGLIHPTTHEYMEFSAPVPEYFGKLLERLRNS